MSHFQIAPPPKGHEDSTIIASVSLGKDSTAMLCALRELGVSFRAVFADTGWEAPETYDQLGVIEQALGITIEKVGFEGGMRAAILHRAGFPTRMQRFCTKQLKVLPLRAYHDRVIVETGLDTVSVVGIRADESADRRDAALFEYSDEWRGYVWRPLVAATVEDVLALHHRHGVPVNPLYKRGHGRVGCYPCIYSSKEELALIAEHAPWRIDEIRELERTCESLRAERNAEKPGRYAHMSATFFRAAVADRYESQRAWVPAPPAGKRPKGRLAPEQGPPPEGASPEGSWRIVRVPVYKPMHIDDMVSWANTSRGGRQLKVIREEPQGGCFRWGMCEPPAKPSAGEE